MIGFDRNKSDKLRKATDTSMIKKYFTGMTKEGMERLYKTFQLDFDLFQYSVPQYVWDVV